MEVASFGQHRMQMKVFYFILFLNKAVIYIHIGKKHLCIYMLYILLHMEYDHNSKLKRIRYGERSFWS